MCFASLRDDRFASLRDKRVDVWDDYVERRGTTIALRVSCLSLREAKASLDVVCVLDLSKSRG